MIGTLIGLLTLLTTSLSFSQTSDNDSSYANLDTFIRASYPFRLLGSGLVTAGIKPTDYLTFQISALGRVPLETNYVDAFARLSDSFIRLELFDWSLSVGNLVIPWSGTRATMLNNRVNPIDYHCGPDFTSSITGRIPQWGALVRGSIWETDIQALVFARYTPNDSSLVASQQGGVQIGRYQSLWPTPFSPDSFWGPTLGLRVHRNLNDALSGGMNILWGYNQFFSIPSHTLTHELSVGLDASYQLGTVVLQSELLFEHNKTTWLATHSKDLNVISGAIGIEMEYGDWISGSLELLDVCWLGLMNRLAIATSLEGTVTNLIAWQIKGEVGILQPDILTTVDVHHNWSNLGLSAGIFSNIYAGTQNSPGWMRREATTIGLFARHEL